ncbi:MAG: MamI family restriction endonuclease [Mycobacteriales bacterium]
MKPELQAVLQRNIAVRRQILTRLSHEQRMRLLGLLFRDCFVDLGAMLLKWAALTGQSAQIDTGYVAQHVASIVLSEPGQGFRGKGLDLADGGEVKSAANISGVDRPRWNHNLGKPADDAARRAKGEDPVWQTYLDAPVVFYLLFDRVVSSDITVQPEVRVRAWCLNPSEDSAWTSLVRRFVAERKPSQYNLQLHPPVGYDDDIVVNTLGSLDFADIKVFEARISQIDSPHPVITWTQPPANSVIPIGGRSRALPYAKDRPSRLVAADDVLADMSQIALLVPDMDLADLSAAVAAEQAVSATVFEQGTNEDEAES